MQNEDLLSPVVDIRNQPALVMADVKHKACPHAVNISPTLLYIWEITPRRALGDSIPSRQGLVLFEDHRARLNCYFCSTLQHTEWQDSARLETRYRKYEKARFEEVQVDGDVQAVEDRRRVEGKPPKVQFFTQEKQSEWERQYPKPPADVASEPDRSRGEQL